MESSVGESYVGRTDPARFQHTLAGQMVAERDLKTAENLLCAGICAHTFVMCAAVVFRLVVAQILLTWVMANGQDALCLLTHQPEVSHVHRPRTLPFDGVMEDANGSGIITLDGGGWLGMSHLCECCAKRRCSLAVVKQSCCLGL